MWIATDEDGHIHLYNIRPQRPWTGWVVFHNDDIWKVVLGVHWIQQ